MKDVRYKTHSVTYDNSYFNKVRSLLLNFGYSADKVEELLLVLVTTGKISITHLNVPITYCDKKNRFFFSYEPYVFI